MNDLASLLEQSFRQMLQSVHTAMPGQVESYSGGRASVKPLISRQLDTGEVEELPVLNDVPIIWPRSGGASMTFPVKPGDKCLLIFVERSLDEFKSNGSMVAPQDPRTHSISDAVALMGFAHFDGGSSGDTVEIKMGSTTINIGDGDVKIDAPSVSIKSPSVAIDGNVSVTGDFSASGGMTVDGSLAVQGGSLTHRGTNVGDDHEHGGVERGGSKTDGPE